MIEVLKNDKVVVSFDNKSDLVEYVNNLKNKRGFWNIKQNGKNVYASGSRMFGSFKTLLPLYLKNIRG